MQPLDVTVSSLKSPNISETFVKEAYKGKNKLVKVQLFFFSTASLLEVKRGV